ncbi:hypothetical protein [Actinoplanes sp. NBRC 101535]|uniref:hypothetical protein n=1 Tax=Actinoplanes sp. NBRC 101535 TaxID=3032196 RepID=UPI0024A52CAF|nr:hypothetical protein [Actinoplanes sp. NBRC 101535]GLY06959.1 hypothetical protein Acsp01_73380 [Actinoplanes sp. NBRC 101535]
MRWFRFGRDEQRQQHDPERAQALLHTMRERYGVHVAGGFADQAEAAGRQLQGDDGLLVAAAILREVADGAFADLTAQVGGRMPFNRRSYRPLWKHAGHNLRYPMFALPGGLHPYIQVNAAVTVVGGQAKRAIQVNDPGPLLEHLMEILDLTFAGWEFGRVRVDADAAALAARLIDAARWVRDAMGDPPPLPPPVRELMRRNNTVPVLDAAGDWQIGGFNPGKEMREALLA